MSLEGFQPYAYISIDITAVLAALFGCLLLYKLFKKGYKQDSESNLKKVLTIIFSFLVIGFVVYAIAEVIYSVQYDIVGGTPNLGIPDFFWSIGYVLTLLGYLFFTIYMYSQHGQVKRGIIVTALTGIASVSIVFYLLQTYVFGFQAGESSLEMFLDYFYPIMSALIVMFSVNVYLFFRKLKNIGTALMYVAIGNILAFIGDMAYVYYSWNEIYGPVGVISDTFYLAQYIITAIAFYTLFKKIKLEK